MGKRYAEGTAVSVESSRGEITGVLTKHGCMRMAWATEPEGDTLQFELGGQQYRFKIVRPTVDAVKAMYREDGRDWSRVYDAQSKVDAEWRRRWRAHVLLLKAKLEFVEGGDTTLEQEFMPALVTKNGATLGELMATAKGQQLLLGTGA
jgi:hypothetical protein